MCCEEVGCGWGVNETGLEDVEGNVVEHCFLREGVVDVWWAKAHAVKLSCSWYGIAPMWSGANLVVSKELTFK